MLFWFGISWLIAGCISFILACYFFFIDDKINFSIATISVCVFLFFLGWFSLLLYINMIISLYIESRKRKVIGKNNEL